LMAIAALAVGVLYREISKAYLAGVPLSDAIAASYYLSVAHGHTFMTGVLIPAALATLTYVAIKLGGELSPRPARRGIHGVRHRVADGVSPTDLQGLRGSGGLRL